MNKGGFSWRRFLGISAFKAKISRSIGVPLTRSGRQRKLGAFTEKALIGVFLLFISATLWLFQVIMALFIRN